MDNNRQTLEYKVKGYKSDDLDTSHNNSTSVKIKQCRSNNKTNTEYTNLKGYYSKVMIKSEGILQ